MRFCAASIIRSGRGGATSKFGVNHVFSNFIANSYYSSSCLIYRNVADKSSGFANSGICESSHSLGTHVVHSVFCRTKRTFAKESVQISGNAGAYNFESEEQAENND